MELLIDIGNSSIKWACAEESGELFSHGEASHAGTLPEEVVSEWCGNIRPAHVRVANVAGATLADELNRLCRQQWQLEPEFVTVRSGQGGITLAYAELHHFGVDRWLTLLAARQMKQGMIAVVDAGTAVTVDILSAQNEHRGGIIIPGLELMLTALLQKSPAVRHAAGTAVNSDSTLFGNDTRSCIEKGALYAVTGAIEHLLGRLRDETGEEPAIIISGGDAKRIQAELGRPCLYVPDLVLRGLQIVEGDVRE
jgi:type III pantothenate kinase